MKAKIEIEIEANDAQGIEDRIREIAGQTFNWQWTNGGSRDQISKHFKRGGVPHEWATGDGANGWTASLVVSSY